MLCALASGGEARRAWLLGAGILPLLRRLALEHYRDVSGEGRARAARLPAPPACLQRRLADASQRHAQCLPPKEK